MASKLLPTDQQNFVRLGIAVVDKIKLPMKDILILSIKPINLYNAISSCTVLLTGKYKLNDEQRKLCFLLPPDIPDYGKFDVSLLYKLIQNLCPHLVPTQGWGKQPKATDIKIADDIERLRQFRNGMLGHLESSSIPDALFEARWAEIEDVMKRMDSFLRKQGFNPVNYEKELADVRKCNFGFEDMEKFKLMLEATLRIMKEKEEFPTITLRGNTTIMCGETAYLEADIEQTSTSTQNWPITWHKVRGNNLEQIDTSTGKYTDSTNRQLVIQRTSKEDQGDYQTIISGSSNGQHIKIPSNVLTLKVSGERPVLKKLEVTSGKDGITLHYKYEVSQDSPKVHHIAWTKNGQVITKEQEKYLGGDLINSSLTITSPSLQDSGEYTCIIANAVGAVAESIILGVPKVSILAESVCYGENTDINSVVSSCPPAERAVWEKSIDAVIFETIYVRDRKYANSILDPSNPVLRLTSLTFDDKLYYRLRVWNSIGECVSNTILLNVTGDPPNISNGHETNIKSRIVILTCQVFLYKQSPLLSEIVWKKNGSVIDIFGSGGKYTGGTLDEPSLTITNVDQSDAGTYQCKASNAVGSTIGNKIILGVPELEIQGPNLQEIDKKVFTALIKSVPEPIQAQWSIKNESSGSYKALDITSEEYKGSSNNLPKPLLCIKQNVTLQNHLIHIEVQNFIGTTTREIPDERCSCSNEEVPNTKATSKLTAIFSKKGSSIRFNNLKLDLIREISERDLKPLISTLTALTSMELLSLDNLPTIEDLFIFLLKEEIFQERNVIMMQYLMRSIKRPDLELKCVEYAIKNKQALCYFEENKIP
ncbi:titin-like, partial [Saccostrea cucullata]|uniref:titin-like n=1 Tax=Saccostrea cuccullata TaxID=36930 RepID=UPI002ED44BD8